jgi:hypothetical protein
MESARTMKPYLVGLTLIDEMEADICVDEVDEHTAKVYDEFSSEQPTSKTLKKIMESKIQELALGYHRRETKEDHRKQRTLTRKGTKTTRTTRNVRGARTVPVFGL